MPILFKQKKLNLFIEQGLKDDVPKEISDARELIALAPVFPIYQSRGKTRVVADFRAINKSLIFQSDAIPPVDLLIQNLYPYTIYSTLDLKSAYYNVPLDIKDARIGITTIHGNYQFAPIWTCIIPSGIHKTYQIYHNRSTNFLQCYLDDS